MDKMIDIDSRIDQDLAMDTTMGSSSDQDHTMDIMDKMKDRSPAPAHPRTRTHATFLRISWFIVQLLGWGGKFEFLLLHNPVYNHRVREESAGPSDDKRGGEGTGDWADLQRMSRENLDEG